MVRLSVVDGHFHRSPADTAHARHEGRDTATPGRRRFARGAWSVRQSVIAVQMDPNPGGDDGGLQHHDRNKSVITYLAGSSKYAAERYVFGRIDRLKIESNMCSINIIEAF